jgi:hypothetical protein
LSPRRDSIDRSTSGEDPLKYHYATETAAGACPGCGQPLILYRHVHLTSGPERHNSTLLDTIFCCACAAELLEPAELPSMEPADSRSLCTGWRSDYRS